MPILFKTEIREGAVHGKGVFACEDIPEGATWWVSDPDAKPATDQYLPNIIYTEQTLNQLTNNRTAEEVAAILHRTMHYMEGNLLIFLRDGTEAMNHSFEPNSICILDKEGNWKNLKSVAKRLIKAGEEIT